MIDKNSTFFFFQAQTVDATSTAYTIKYPNKTAIIKFWGTWGGSNIKFQTLAPQSNPNVWIDIPNALGDTLFNQDGQATLLYLVQNEQVRAVLSDATGTTSINASVEIF